MEIIGEVIKTSTTGSEFEWIIPEFQSLLVKGSRWYCSPSFYVLGTAVCCLDFRLGDSKRSTPSMSQKDTLGYLDICFTMDNSKKPPPVPEVSFAIKNANGKKEQERHDPCQRLYSDSLQYIYHHYISRAEFSEQASELMPSNTLTVICTVSYSESKIGKSETSECMHCEETLDAKAISFHENNCYYKPVKCPECTGDVVLGDLYFHGCQSTKEADEARSAKCTHCQELVDAKTISLHEKKCLIKCPDCSEVVALKNWHDHECKTTKPEGEVCTFKSSAIHHLNNALNDFKELFLQKEDCDVVLKVKNQDFPAHRNILKARSAVLASTFRTDMKEKATGVVEIDDCDPSCFSDFLCFLYCADVSLISQENVFGLFTAADKYNVRDLRDLCMDFMRENLSVDTFCDTMALALLHLETELIELTTDFFTKNAPDIILTVKWQVFLAENPTQCNELFVKLLKPGSSIKK